MKSISLESILVPARVLLAAWLWQALPHLACGQASCYSVNCPQVINAPCEGPWGAHVTFSVTSSNICNPSSPPTVTYSIPPGSVFPPGPTVVYATNQIPGLAPVVCVFVINVDTCCGTNCVGLICPPDTMVPCDPALGGAMVDLTQPQFQPQLTNYCGGPVPTGLIFTTFPSPPASGGPIFFPPGPHTVLNCITDPLTGHQDCCCFTLIVAGNCSTAATNPCPVVVICPSNLVVCVSNALGTANVPLQTPTVTNLCGRPVVVRNTVTSVPAGYFFPLGNTTVATCVSWFDDFTGKGGTNCCCYEVTVQCCTNPCSTVLQCPGDMTVDCPGPNGIQLNYTAYGTNDCLKTVLICTPPPGTVIFGNTNVCCQLVDTATGLVVTQCCFHVTTLCPTNCVPTISCPSNIYVLCSGPRVKVAYPPIVVTDNCYPAASWYASPPSGSYFPLGCTTVNVVAWDPSGHTNTCTFKVCVLPVGCYLRNGSFEQIVAGVPAPNFCGDPISDAIGWSALAGAPKLFRPPAGVPANCWGNQVPCQGTNYAGISGGYTATAGFQTDQMLGQLIAPLNNGRPYRLRACLGLAAVSPGPVLVEFVLANQVNPAQQTVVNQTWVTQRPGWQYLQAPCFVVPRTNVWDALIIRAAQVPPTAAQYPLGEVYIDNVNVCCCAPVLTWNGTTNLTWGGSGTLLFNPSLGGSNTWQNLGSQFSMDPISGMSMLRLSPSVLGSSPTGFFEMLAPELDTMDCGCYP